MAMPSHYKKPCMGDDCPGCPMCMAKGGPTRDFEKGVHKPMLHSPGTSFAGEQVRGEREARRTESREEGIRRGTAGQDIGAAKDKHHTVLSEMRLMKKPNLYAEGGEVDQSAEQAEEDRKMREFKNNASQMDSEDPKWGALHPSIKDASDEKMAHGGEVDDDSELHDAMGHELIESIHKKDRKGIMQAIEAIVLSMKHKEN